MFSMVEFVLAKHIVSIPSSKKMGMNKKCIGECAPYSK